MLRILNHRALATTAIAVAAGIGAIAGVGLAQGTSTPGTPAAVTRAAAPPQPGGILAGVRGILSGLVANGTIDQQQADAIQAQADAGSIDPKQLVQNGVLSDTQMRAVADRIDQLKRSYGS